MSDVVNEQTVQEQGPFDVAWQNIDGLSVRYARGGSGGERIVLFSPWPESIFGFAPAWAGLGKQFEGLAVALPAFRRSEGGDGLFAPPAMGEFHPHAIQ